MASVGQVLLADIAGAVVGPFSTFLTATAAAAGDPAKEAAAWAALTGSVIGAAPTLEALAIGQLTSILQTKLNAAVAAAQANAAK